mmetsp:Transcript_45984/g.82801  ORF Transcript_45984/g.82801 Transcript_45984/m.82801 type:complete len:100 (+) Transcript_45984:124-423(+)
MIWLLGAPQKEHPTTLEKESLKTQVEPEQRGNTTLLLFESVQLPTCMITRPSKIKRGARKQIKLKLLKLTCESYLHMRYLHGVVAGELARSVNVDEANA